VELQVRFRDELTDCFVEIWLGCVFIVKVVIMI